MTNCFHTNDIAEISKWAKENNFFVLEVVHSIELNKEKFMKIKSEGIEIISFIYCRNFLTKDEEERNLHYENLIKRIEFANEIEVRNITTSTGGDERLKPEENLEKVCEFFKPILDKAKNYGINICFENCVATGNIAISPYMWRLIFKELNYENLKLTFDPSHFLWQGIDIYKALKEFINKVSYFHMKDTEIIREELEDKGITYGENFGRNIWWRHRIPGWGEINWEKFMSILLENKFDGVLSKEHEDPLFEKNEEEVKKALIMSKKFLEELIGGK